MVKPFWLFPRRIHHWGQNFIKMNRKFLFSVFIIVILAGCSSVIEKEYTNNNGQRVVEEWYSETDLKSQTTFLSADSSEYVFCSYYENGQLKDSSRYLDQQPDGLRKYYDQSSDLLHIENYSNGFLNGPHKALYGNGVSNFEGYHINEVKAGEWIFHYPDGRPITYEFYDSTGRVVYFRKYNDSGEFKSSNGSAIIDISVAQNLNSNDTSSVYLVVANPPNCKAILVIIGSDSKELYNKKIHTSRTNCPLTFDEKGKKDLNIQLNIIDIKTGHKEHYHQKFEFIL